MMKTSEIIAIADAILIKLEKAVNRINADNDSSAADLLALTETLKILNDMYRDNCGH